MATETAIESEAEPVAPAAEPPKTKAKAEKDKKPQKDKKGAAAEEADNGGPSVAAHPRAARGVARARGWGGLVGFLITGYLSLPTSTVAAAGLHALIGGVVCYVAVWAGALFLWRRLVMLEIKAKEQELVSAIQAAHARSEPPRPGEQTRSRTAA